VTGDEGSCIRRRRTDFTLHQKSLSIKSRKFILMGHVALIEDTRNAHKMLIYKSLDLQT
jgi:hypothetical protein